MNWMLVVYLGSERLPSTSDASERVARYAPREPRARKKQGRPKRPAAEREVKRRMLEPSGEEKQKKLFSLVQEFCGQIQTIPPQYTCFFEKLATSYYGGVSMSGFFVVLF